MSRGVLEQAPTLCASGLWRRTKLRAWWFSGKAVVDRTEQSSIVADIGHVGLRLDIKGDLRLDGYFLTLGKYLPVLSRQSHAEDPFHENDVLFRGSREGVRTRLNDADGCESVRGIHPKTLDLPIEVNRMFHDSTPCLEL